MSDNEVERWLDSLGLGRYAEIFADNEIDWDILPELIDEDLEKLGIPLGPRKKLLKAIAHFCSATDEPTSAAASASAVKPAARAKAETEAERRHLTVVFCDMVGSTTLSARLDPEEMREVICSYQNAVAGEIARFEGRVAKFMGDGVLAYFGWPRAHEDDAERAVRAGLAVIRAVGLLKAPTKESLAVRIGIATGIVVVGDLVGDGAAQEEAVVGKTPNLAARLQEIAAPGTILISPETRRLLGDLFEVEDIGSQTVKGFAEPLSAWRVIDASRAESRFEALHAAGLTPLAGREHEMALLLDRFDLARGGEGQVVFLSGEAGIGKSRIVRALRERLADESHTRLSYYCSPYFTNSALYPVVNELERAAGHLPSDTADTKLDKLEAVLGQAEEQGSEALALLAALCSIPTGDRYPAFNLTPQARKARTLDALLGQLARLAGRRPVLMVVEDAHWIDPTSAELFGMVIDRIQRLPVLLLITFRPEFKPPWPGYTHVTSLSLGRLGQRQGAAMVEHLARNKALPTEILEQILQKTDGVPLFVEELTKTVLESDLLADAGDHYELLGPLPALAIPTTLHDSLMARLDNLAPVKEIAQIGAVVGREFGYELIAALAPMPEEKLRDALDQLVAAELVFRRGTPPDASYTFKHVLVQDAAYQSLLKSRRRQLHARIAEWLEERFAGAASTQPELLAHHCTEAGLLAKAVHYWRCAGEQAARRAATLEAVQHFEKALTLLESQPESCERDAAELKVLIQFGPALMLTRGWAAAEVGTTYKRARELARRLGNSADLVPPLVGSWLYFQGSAQFDSADETTRELFGIARSLDDPDLLLQAHHAAWPIPMLRGAFAPAYQHIEQGLRLYDYERHKQHAFVYMGHDPAVCAHALGAVVAWNLGYLQQARRHADDALHLARRLGHPPSLALALWFIGGAYAARGDSAHALATADELLRLSEEQELVQTRASALVIGGWALAREGQADEGLDRLRAGLAVWHRMCARHYLPPFTCLLAESLMCARRYEEALVHIDEALAYCEETGERWWKARIYQTRGQLLYCEDSRPDKCAVVCFRTAMQIARSQRAKALELRAATDLARLLREQGKQTEAFDTLASVYGWFTDGFDTPDLMAAKALLEELS